MYTPEQREAWIDAQMRKAEIDDRIAKLTAEIDDVKLQAQQEIKTRTLKKENEIEALKAERDTLEG